MKYGRRDDQLRGDFVEFAALIAVLVLVGSTIPGNSQIIYYR